MNGQSNIFTRHLSISIILTPRRSLEWEQRAVPEADNTKPQVWCCESSSDLNTICYRLNIWIQYTTRVKDNDVSQAKRLL